MPFSLIGHFLWSRYFHFNISVGVLQYSQVDIVLILLMRKKVLVKFTKLNLNLQWNTHRKTMLSFYFETLLPSINALLSCRNMKWIGVVLIFMYLLLLSNVFLIYFGHREGVNIHNWVSVTYRQCRKCSQNILTRNITVSLTFVL